MSQKLSPFRSLVWPGTGPRVDWRRDWPELAMIAAAAWLFGRGAPAAILLSLLAAGLGMWWLGVVLGAGRLGRTWAGLVFTFAGVAAALDSGSAGLMWGAWIPWALAWGLAAVLARRRLYAALAAVALGLALLGGDRGLTIATLVMLGFLLLFAALELTPGKQPRLAFDRHSALVALAVAALGCGLAAVQWLPTLAAGAGEQGLVPHVGLAGLLAALFSKPAVTAASAPYVGIPLLCLAGLPLAIGRKSKRPLVGLSLAAAAALLIAASGWLDAARLPSALLAWVVVALIALAGVGLEALWQWVLANQVLRRVRVPEAAAWSAARVGIVGLPAIALLAAVDLFVTHRPLLLSIPAAGIRELLVTNRAQQPLAFWAGAVMSGLAFFGILAMIVSDQRSQRRRLETEAVYAAGALRPAEPLDLPDGTPVHVTVEPAGAGEREREGAEARSFAPLRMTEEETGRGAPPRVTEEGTGDSTPLRVTEEETGRGAPPRVTEEGTGDSTPLRMTEGAQEQGRGGAEERSFAPLRMTEEEAGRGASPRLAEGEVARKGSVMARALPWVLFALAIGVYLITRFWDIEKFPIYFFTDEAANPLFAQDLIARDFRGVAGGRFPVYFEVAANRWGPLLSVYIHAISMTLFGKSVLVTRGTQALLSVLAAIAIGLSLKTAFKARFWWAGALLLALAPTWFLHSRTGFETVIAASFYGCFVLFYLLYRTRSPRYLYLAILFGGLTFYTYSNGQLIMAVAGVLLALFDVRYHIKNWRITLPCFALLAVLMIPALRFRATHPGLLESHLRVLDSYWYYDKPLGAKLAQLVKTWAYGLSPSYWFIPNVPKETYEVRHLMKGYGNLAIWTLPFFLIGVGISLWRAVKGSVQHRIVLLAALATPAGAALAQVALTRVMAFVVPATILIAIGLEAVLDWVKRKFSHWTLAPIVFVALMIPAGLMTRDALVNGPLWYRDYELYGMQYGATQLFGDEIPAYLAEHPDRRVIVSPTWANGTDNFIRFFLSPEQQARVQMLNVDYFMTAQRPLDASMVLVMTQAEYDRARASEKFKSVEVERTVPYPDDRTGFYFVRLAYADNLDEILNQERTARSKPVSEQFILDSQPVEVLHSQLDMGQLADLFDGDTFTLVRGLEANPLLFELTFPQPRTLTGLKVTVGSMDFGLKVSLFADVASEPVVYEQTFRGLPPDPTVDLAFDRGPAQASRVRIEVQQLNAGAEVHIHLRELTFR